VRLKHSSKGGVSPAARRTGGAPPPHDAAAAHLQVEAWRPQGGPPAGATPQRGSNRRHI
jgi:hypothetical protein